ncbi:MAG: hypothetical protein M0Z38_00265 [Deltaproteobacteria bacterium]|nr:hypothetical protein [Deltaproteobacteria bacterium]
MRVRATAFGFYLHKRKLGDEFEFEGKPSGKWMEPVDAAALAAFKKAGIKVSPKPVALPSLPNGKTTLAGAAVEKGNPAEGGSTGDKEVI